MPVIVSYICVILIWSTTPLAIKLSNDSLSFSIAVALRMSIALIVLALLVATWKTDAVLKRKNWQLYLAGGIGVFPNMLIVYFAADYIPSGMIAIVFALNPVVAAVLSQFILKESLFSLRKVLAVIVSLLGLLLIFYEQISLDSQAWIGMLSIFVSTVLFSISQVSVKYFQRGNVVNAIEQVLGSLCFAVPGLVLSWWCLDGSMPEYVSMRSLNATLYLAVVGTVIGFYAYFYILNSLSVGVVSLIPLITPVLALWFGAYYLDEAITQNIIIGTSVTLLGLLLYGDLLGIVKSNVRRLIRY